MPPKMYSFCLHKYQYMLAWTYFEKQKAVKATGKKKKDSYYAGPHVLPRIVNF